MNLIPAFLMLCFTTIQGPQVKKLNDQNTIEIFNSIDHFKQYHTIGFKVNIFRTTPGQPIGFSEDMRSNYIVGILNYSETTTTQLFEIGSFHEPQIMEMLNQRGGIKISIDHGKTGKRTSSVFMITKDRVEMMD